MKSRTHRMWQRFMRTGKDPAWMRRRNRKYARRQSGGLYDRVDLAHGCGHKYIQYVRVECGKGLIHKGRKA